MRLGGSEEGGGGNGCGCGYGVALLRLLGTVAILLLVTHPPAVDGQRLRDMMYESLYSGGACYRRLNGTHQIGCTSKRGGSVGVVHAISGIEDVEWIIKNGTAAPYAVLLPMKLFNEEIVNLLISHSDIIAGIVVYNNGSDTIESFSHEQRCPNIRSQWTSSENVCHNSANDSNVWNPYGTGLMYRDIPFSIFYLPPDKKDDINKIYDCFIKFNSFDLNTQSSRSLCAVEMDAFMFAAVNSEVCIRRSNIVRNLSPIRYCDPLSDRSIFTTLFPRGSYSEKDNSQHNSSVFEDKFILFKPNITETKGTVALVTAGMDATTMLEGFGGGSVTTVSGLVTLLSTAHVLGLMIPADQYKNYNKNVMFMALNGETYDYIGSQRMAWDLSTDSFPYTGPDPAPPLLPMSIGPHLHIGQLQNGQDIHAFSPNYNDSERRNAVKSFIESIKLMGSNGNVSNPILEVGDNIPPSSVHSFLRFLNSSVTQMASVVLADHGPNFKNKYYQSVLDNKLNLNYLYSNLSTDVKRGSDGVEFPDSKYPAGSVQVRLADISTAIAYALYEHVTDKPYDGKIRASPFIVDELLHCYLDTIACHLLSVAQSPSALPPSVPVGNIPPASLYVGVSVWYSPIAHATAQFAAFLSGANISRSKDDCKSLENESVYYEWVAGWFGDGMCIRSIINFTQAGSPAFTETDYDFTSGKFSTWTESVWRSMSLRILVKPAPWRESLTIGIGCTVFVLSIILIILGRRHVTWLIDTENRIDTPNQAASRVDC
ncbi:nicastrin [Arctopsyche grandis]|uniref:nicastrin n=1 Tax=Arctopsyche grandis TaxID=121162 RepID=UPI00406D942D